MVRVMCWFQPPFMVSPFLAADNSMEKRYGYQYKCDQIGVMRGLFIPISFSYKTFVSCTGNKLSTSQSHRLTESHDLNNSSLGFSMNIVGSTGGIYIETGASLGAAADHCHTTIHVSAADDATRTPQFGRGTVNYCRRAIRVVPIPYADRDLRFGWRALIISCSPACIIAIG